jgi:hypothetical protein
VTFEDLRDNWGTDTITLCKPLVEMDLQTRDHISNYRGFQPELDEVQAAKVREREAEEAAFSVPPDFDAKLRRYLGEVPLFRLLYRKGVGWRLNTSGEERFYSTKNGTVSHKIPENYDFVVSLPGKVLDDALSNNVLTDLGITMFLRIDARIDARRIYGAFLLMGLHDAGYFAGARDFATLARFYAPYFVPTLMRGSWRLKRLGRVPTQAQSSNLQS